VGKFYSIFRNAEKITQGEIYTIKDITSTEYTLVDSLPKLFDIQCELATYKNTFVSNRQGEFVNKNYREIWGEVLTGWQKLNFNEKLKKFNKMMSNELNVFIYFKDPTFFK